MELETKLAWLFGITILVIIIFFALLMADEHNNTEMAKACIKEYATYEEMTPDCRWAVARYNQPKGTTSVYYAPVFYK